MCSPVTRLRAPLAALVSTLLLAGCGALADDGDGSDLQVVAAFYPLHYVAERVAGEHATVENLTLAGTEPHDLELTVRETADLGSADLVVFQGGFQPAVDAAAEGRNGTTLLDAAEVVSLQPVEEHDHEDEHAEEHAEEDEHDHGDLDPHFWLDPLRLAEFATAVADRLAELDPDHASAYELNADQLRADLEDLDAAYAEGLAECSRDVVVVNHDAFGYLAKYGLHFEPIVGLSPDAEPTPADLARLQELVREEGLTTVFAETLVDERAVASFAADLDLRVDVLDPVEGLTDETSGEDYLSLMDANLSRLQEANDC